MLVFDIKRYAINDGPGIRTTIFMKGCPLSCVWCHNAEGISPAKEKLYTQKRCIGCLHCVETCPQQALHTSLSGIMTDRSRCTVCGKCADVCPARAMEISGTEYTTAQLMAEIEKEMLFMDKSEGGVTFSGGEPLMHPEPLRELLVRCGELGMHRAVDTTLYARPEIVRSVMEVCELFLIDLKHMDDAAHRKYCGVGNERILSNIRMVAENGHDFLLRIPLIDGINSDEENIRRSACFLADIPWKRRVVNLLPYHDIGKGKHEKRGTSYNPKGYVLSTPSAETIQRCRAIFATYGLETTVGG